MGGEAFEFGRHAPFIIVAYIASIVVVGGLIISRRNKLKKALETENDDNVTGGANSE